MIFLVACTSLSSDPPLPAPTNAAPTPPQFKSLEITLSPKFETHDPENFLVANPQTLTRTRYYLDVALDYAAKQLSVAQTLIYANNTGVPITELPLIVPPGNQTGVFSLISVEIDQAFPGTKAKMEGAQINLYLNPPLEPGQYIEFSLNYQLNLPAGGLTLGYTDLQLLLADWYPLIPPYLDSTGWLINPPGQVGEHLVYPLSDFHLNLCLEPTQEELVVAASAPLADSKGDCYRYYSEGKRNFSMAISPYYQVETAANEFVTVMTYTFPEHAELGSRAAELAVQAWDTFRDLFGNNQRDFLSIVAADIYDGLETDGLIYLSEWYYQTADPTPQNYFELLIVHETVHQWFYAYVHNDQAHQPWLDEALATYSEVLFYEIHHPHLVDWWWNYRVATYMPEGAVNAAIYDFSQYRPYINAVYLRGASFLQALRNEIGETAFFEALQRYTQADKGMDNIRQADDFLEAITQVSDINISTIVKKYFQ